MNWQNRAHFFAVSAQLMRRILVDAARKMKGRDGNNAGFETTFDEAFSFRPDRYHDLLRLDEALIALAEFDERKSRVVELRFFGGLSVQETAAVLNISSELSNENGH